MHFNLSISPVGTALTFRPRKLSLHTTAAKTEKLYAFLFAKTLFTFKQSERQSNSLDRNCISCFLFQRPLKTSRLKPGKTIYTHISIKLYKQKLKPQEAPYPSEDAFYLTIRNKYVYRLKTLCGMKNSFINNLYNGPVYPISPRRRSVIKLRVYTRLFDNHFND